MIFPPLEQEAFWWEMSRLAASGARRHSTATVAEWMIVTRNASRERSGNQTKAERGTSISRMVLVEVSVACSWTRFMWQHVMISIALAAVESGVVWSQGPLGVPTLNVMLGVDITPALNMSWWNHKTCFFPCCLVLTLVFWCRRVWLQYDLVMGESRMCCDEQGQ